MPGLEDYVEIKLRRYGTSDVFVARFTLYLVRSAPRPLLDAETLKKVLDYVKSDMTNSYVNEVLRLGFNSLEKRKLRDLRFFGCDIVVTALVRPNLITILKRYKS